MRYVSTKTILSPYMADGWFASNYSMNLYRGCCHGCIYCDSRSECYGIEHFDEVRAKKDALAILEKELKQKQRKGIVLTGAMSDPYNPFEAREKLTRGAIELCNRHGFGFMADTKSHNAVRDIDVLQSVARHSPAGVNFTITTYDDALCQKIEPHVSLSSQRFAAMECIASAGLFTGVLLQPILPFINDTVENITNIVKRACECGAQYIFPFHFGVTLRQNQRDYFLLQLNKHFPGLARRYIDHFGMRYACPSPNEEALWQTLCEQCARYGMAYDMPQISERIRKKYQSEQLSFY